MNNFGWEVGDIILSKKERYGYDDKLKKFNDIKSFSSGESFEVIRFDSFDSFGIDLIWLYNKKYKPHGLFAFRPEEFEEYFTTLAEWRDKQIDSILND
jgi:hypothetical protein